MTEKELLYVEDALGHEQYFQTQCRDTAGRIEDGELNALLSSLSRSTARYSAASWACCKGVRAMNDRDLMENMLMLEKGACELFMHGTIESSSTDVHQTFNTSLNASLRLQDEIYSKMQSKGWYPTEQVQQCRLNEVKQKFAQA